MLRYKWLAIPAPGEGDVPRRRCLRCSGNRGVGSGDVRGALEMGSKCRPVHSGFAVSCPCPGVEAIRFPGRHGGSRFDGAPARGITSGGDGRADPQHHLGEPWRGSTPRSTTLAINPSESGLAAWAPPGGAGSPWRVSTAPVMSPVLLCSVGVARRKKRRKRWQLRSLPVEVGARFRVEAYDSTGNRAPVYVRRRPRGVPGAWTRGGDPAWSSAPAAAGLDPLCARAGNGPEHRHERD